MDKKVIEFDRKNQNFSEEKVIRFFSSFRDKVNLKLKKIENKSDNEKIVTNKFKKTINSIIELKGFNYNQMNSYAFNVSKIFRKQADGSFELSTVSHQIKIIDRTEAAATLQTIASIDNSKIYTYAYYPYADEAYYEHGAAGTRIINQDGSFNYPVHNYIVPRLIQRT